MGQHHTRTRTYTADISDLTVEAEDEGVPVDELTVESEPPHAALGLLGVHPAAVGLPADPTWDAVVGGAKGLANSAIGLGELFYRHVPGMRSVSEAIAGPSDASAFDAAREATAPSGIAQQVGFGAEQVGEFFAVPAAKGGLVSRVVKEGATAGGLTAAQGGDARSMALSALPGAATPIASHAAPAFSAASRALRESAGKNISQAFSATTKGMKRDVERITPRILDEEGILAATRPGIVKRADTELDALGTQFDSAGAGLPTGDRLPTADVRAGIQRAMRGLEVRGSAGRPVPTNPQKYRALQELDSTVEQLGDRVSRETLQTFKEEWDDIVARSGGYSDKTGDALTQAQKWAYREGAGAIRRVLAEDSPDIAALNAEWSFWSRVRDVAEESVSRERPHKGAMRLVLGGIGAGAGGATGDSAVDRMQSAVMGGVIGAQGLRVIQSPGWKFASAQAKVRLADALMAADPERVGSAIGRVIASIPARYRPVQPVPSH